MTVLTIAMILMIPTMAVMRIYLMTVIMMIMTPA